MISYKQHTVVTASVSFALGLVACLWVAAFFSYKGHPPSHNVIALAFSFCCYFPLLFFANQLSEKNKLTLTFLAAFLAGIVLVSAPPTLSDDIYRYIWDGHVLTQGINPYRYPPNHPNLISIRIPLWDQVSYPHIATIYPPLAQLFFGFCAFIYKSIFTVKFLLLLAHLGTIFVLSKIKLPNKNQAALVYGTNPLVLAETCLAGHVDALVALFISCALVTLQKRKIGLTTLLAGLVTHIKLVGIFFIPVLFSKRKWTFIVGLGFVAIAMLPSAFHPEKTSAGLGHYSQRWQGNGSLFQLIEPTVNIGLKQITTTETICIPNWKNWAQSLENTAFDPSIGHGKTFNSKASSICLQTDYVAAMIARISVFVLAMIAAFFFAKKLSPLSALRGTFWAILLLSPQVHPWYLLWLLPIEAANRKWGAIVWSALILLAYHPLDRWVSDQIWEENIWIQLAQYIPLFLFLFGENLFRKNKKH